MPVALLKYDSYGKTSIVSDWAGLYCFLRNTPGGRKFRLMYWFVWSFFSRVEVCRHEDRFVALLRSFYRPAYCVGGGGVPLLFGRLLPLDL